LQITLVRVARGVCGRGVGLRGVGRRGRVERGAGVRAGVSYSGMGPDFRVLVRRGQKVAQEYFLTYKEPIPVLQLTRQIAEVVQEFTQSGGVRPFGVSLLVAGVDHDGPQLYQIDPSGTYFGWKASAIGKNQLSAKSFLEKRYAPDGELEDAVHMALLTLREGVEGGMTSKNIEVAIADKERGFRVLTPAEIDDYLEETE
jgi:20S proteasome subunit alpha 2